MLVASSEPNLGTRVAWQPGPARASTTTMWEVSRSSHVGWGLGLDWLGLVSDSGQDGGAGQTGILIMAVLLWVVIVGERCLLLLLLLLGRRC